VERKALKEREEGERIENNTFNSEKNKN